MIDPQRWRLSYHATNRAEEMRLSIAEVVQLLEEPHIVSEHDRTSKYHGDGTVLHMRGSHTAVVAPGEPSVVITFLYRYRDGWYDSYKTLGEGREVREHSSLPLAPRP